MSVEVAMGEKALPIYPGPKQIRVTHRGDTIFLVRDLSKGYTIFERRNF